MVINSWYIAFADGEELKTVTRCVDFTHTIDNPLKMHLECDQGYVITVTRVLKARREEDKANISWCNSAEFSASDCIHYEKDPTQMLKSLCNTESVCAQKFINTANMNCHGTPPAGYYEINYIHIEFKCVKSKHFYDLKQS